MGFFDIGGDSSAKATAAAVTSPVIEDSSISFDSKDIIISDDTSISFTDETSSDLPHTVGEIFAAPEAEGVTLDSSASLFVADPGKSHGSDINFWFDASASVAEMKMPVADVSAVSTKTEEEVPGDSVFAMPAMAVAPVTEDITDADATIRKAIAELETNASKIRAKVDAAFLEESTLLEKKAAAEEAHKTAMEALQAAAESARKTALEIRKSGERTEQIKALLEAQLA